MMSELTMLLADENEDFRMALAKNMPDCYRICHSANGKQALETAKAAHPDVIIMDLMLSELDGISLLHAIRDLGMHPLVLLVTRMYVHYVFDLSEELGIEYVIRKPCDPAIVIQRLEDLSQRAKAPRKPQVIAPASYVSELLTLLGFSPRHNGSDYLREAVLLMYRQPNITITKELYPSVASICGTCTPLVERSIRTAVNAAWEQNGASWAAQFPSCFGSLNSRPSNGLLITLLADILRSGLPLSGSDSSQSAFR